MLSAVAARGGMPHEGSERTSGRGRRRTVSLDGTWQPRVSAAGRRRLWALVLTHGNGGEPTLAHVCAALAEVAFVEGAAVTLATGATARVTVHADAVGARVEELTLTLGEGPGVDAVATN